MTQEKNYMQVKESGQSPRL